MFSCNNVEWILESSIKLFYHIYQLLFNQQDCLSIIINSTNNNCSARLFM